MINDSIADNIVFRNALILTSKNIASFVYSLFSKAKGKLSHIDILILAVYLDLKEYIEDGSVSIRDISEEVDSSINENCLVIGDLGYCFPDSYLEDDDSLVVVLTKLSCVSFYLALKTDNQDVEPDEITILIDNNYDTVLDLVLDFFNSNGAAFLNDERIRQSVAELLEDDELIDTILSDCIDTSETDFQINDLEDYEFVDYSRNILGTGFTEEKALKFLNEVDYMLDHKKEHDDYIAVLDEKRNEISVQLKMDYPNLSKKEVIKMKNSILPQDNKIAAICFYFGIEVVRDFEECYDLLLKLTKEYDGESAYLLSVMYLKSLHVEYNSKKWIKYLALSCKLGDPEGVSQWKELHKNAKEYYDGKDIANQVAKKEMLKAAAVRANKRSATPLAIFWPLFAFCFIIGITMTISIGASGVVFFLLSIPFLILAIVKTVQYSNYRKFIKKIEKM